MKSQGQTELKMQYQNRWFVGWAPHGRAMKEVTSWGKLMSYGATLRSTAGAYFNVVWVVVPVLH